MFSIGSEGQFGVLDIAVISRGWIIKNAFETDDQFRELLALAEAKNQRAPAYKQVGDADLSTSPANRFDICGEG